jgi:hypothetical protein
MQAAERATLLRRVVLLLLAARLLGQVLAARATGGAFRADRDHHLGYVLLTAASGALLALVGGRFWRAQSKRTQLLLGVVQARCELFAYVTPFSVQG